MTFFKVAEDKNYFLTPRIMKYYKHYSIFNGKRIR